MEAGLVFHCIIPSSFCVLSSLCTQDSILCPLSSSLCYWNLKTNDQVLITPNRPFTSSPIHVHCLSSSDTFAFGSSGGYLLKIDMQKKFIDTQMKVTEENIVCMACSASDIYIAICTMSSLLLFSGSTFKLLAKISLEIGIPQCVYFHENSSKVGVIIRERGISIKEFDIKKTLVGIVQQYTPVHVSMDPDNPSVRVYFSPATTSHLPILSREHPQASPLPSKTIGSLISSGSRNPGSSYSYKQEVKSSIPALRPGVVSTADIASAIFTQTHSLPSVFDKTSQMSRKSMYYPGSSVSSYQQRSSRGTPSSQPSPSSLFLDIIYHNGIIIAITCEQVYLYEPRSGVVLKKRHIDEMSGKGLITSVGCSKAKTSRSYTYLDLKKEGSHENPKRRLCLGRSDGSVILLDCNSLDILMDIHPPSDLRKEVDGSESVCCVSYISFFSLTRIIVVYDDGLMVVYDISNSIHVACLLVTHTFTGNTLPVSMCGRMVQEAYKGDIAGSGGVCVWDETGSGVCGWGDESKERAIDTEEGMESGKFKRLDKVNFVATHSDGMKQVICTQRGFIFSMKYDIAAAKMRIEHTYCISLPVLCVCISPCGRFVIASTHSHIHILSFQLIPLSTHSVSMGFTSIRTFQASTPFHGAISPHWSDSPSQTLFYILCGSHLSRTLHVSAVSVRHVKEEDGVAVHASFQHLLHVLKAKPDSKPGDSPFMSKEKDILGSSAPFFTLSQSQKDTVDPSKKRTDRMRNMMKNAVNCLELTQISAFGLPSPTFPSFISSSLTHSSSHYSNNLLNGQLFIHPSGLFAFIPTHHCLFIISLPFLSVVAKFHPFMSKEKDILGSSAPFFTLSQSQKDTVDPSKKRTDRMRNMMKNAVNCLELTQISAFGLPSPTFPSFISSSLTHSSSHYSNNLLNGQLFIHPSGLFAFIPTHHCLFIISLPFLSVVAKFQFGCSCISASYDNCLVDTDESGLYTALLLPTETKSMRVTKLVVFETGTMRVVGGIASIPRIYTTKDGLNQSLSHFTSSSYSSSQTTSMAVKQPHLNVSFHHNRLYVSSGGGVLVYALVGKGILQTLKKWSSFGRKYDLQQVRRMWEKIPFSSSSIKEEEQPHIDQTRDIAQSGGSSQYIPSSIPSTIPIRPKIDTPQQDKVQISSQFHSEEGSSPKKPLGVDKLPFPSVVAERHRQKSADFRAYVASQSKTNPIRVQAYSKTDKQAVNKLMNGTTSVYVTPNYYYSSQYPTPSPKLKEKEKSSKLGLSQTTPIDSSPGREAVIPLSQTISSPSHARQTGQTHPSQSSQSPPVRYPPQALSNSTRNPIPLSYPSGLKHQRPSSFSPYSKNRYNTTTGPIGIDSYQRQGRLSQYPYESSQQQYHEPSIIDIEKQHISQPIVHSHPIEQDPPPQAFLKSVDRMPRDSLSKNSSLVSTNMTTTFNSLPTRQESPTIPNNPPQFGQIPSQDTTQTLTLSSRQDPSGISGKSSDEIVYVQWGGMEKEETVEKMMSETHGGMSVLDASY
ncbi:hypothetical protein ADUPG1_012770, partial [Aduncisulcus paluster]